MATLIKISDLSAGDWVRHKGKECTIDSIYMAPEGHPHEVALTYQGICYGCAYIDHLEPIPITAEILEKNGFGKKTFTQDQLLRIVEPNGNVPFICYRWDSERVIIERSNDYMLRVKTKYIHQLQHALRLAGIDKEINL